MIPHAVARAMAWTTPFGGEVCPEAERMFTPKETQFAAELPIRMKRMEKRQIARYFGWGARNLR